MKPVRSRQADVAKAAGVSPAVVSLVINGRLDGNVQISAATQQRVWDAIRALGYVPNPIARSLVGGKNQLLGVFSFEPVFPLQQADFFYPCLVGIEEEAAAQDYNLLLFTRASGPTGRRSIYKDGINTLQLADGAVLLGVVQEQEELQRLVHEQFPFVFIGRHELPDEELSYVAADYAEATVEIVTRMVALGHRRIAFIGPTQRAEWNEDRELGYRIAHQRLGLALDERLVLHCVSGDLTPDLLSRCLAAGTTAFAVDSTTFALTLLHLAQCLGKRVPDDFSVADLDDATVIGYEDEVRAAELAQSLPGLCKPGTLRDVVLSAMPPTLVAPTAPLDMTTILVPRREMGVQAVRLLIELLEHPGDLGPRRMTLPCSVSPGRTLAASSNGETRGWVRRRLKDSL